MTGLPVLGIIEERGKVEYPELKTIDCNETDDREGDGQDIQDNTSEDELVANIDEEEVSEKQQTVQPIRNMEIMTQHLRAYRQGQEQN
jgi:hypothetical protein